MQRHRGQALKAAVSEAIERRRLRRLMAPSPDNHPTHAELAILRDRYLAGGGEIHRLPPGTSGIDASAESHASTWIKRWGNY